MQSRLIKIISELISINDENPNEDLLNIIDELERVVLDMKKDDLEQTIETLRQRVRELMAINGTHKELMGKLIVENEDELAGVVTFPFTSK